MTTNEIKDIYNFIIDKYPLKNLPIISKINTISDIYKLRLSHFSIMKSYDLTKSINLHNISHVYIDNKWISSIKYKHLICRHIRYRDLDYFIKYQFYVPLFNLPNIKIKKICKNNKIIKIKYINTSVKIYKSSLQNHFILHSLNISKNENNLYEELKRLFQNRDNYKTIYFHLYKGGDSIIVLFILLCLCGKREKWMKKICKEIDTYYYHENNITTEKTLIIKEFDEWNLDSDNYFSKQYINFKNLFMNNYSFNKKKYNRKIVLYVNYLCSSASWYLITYLIYAFAEKIIRKTININGIIVKIGYIISDHLEIRGVSSTSSGDALECTDKNEKIFKLFGKKYNISTPTKFFLEESVKKIDYNRFWLQNN